MIQVYSPGNENFTANGDMTLFPSEAMVHVILNSSWEATITHPLDEDGRWKYLVKDAVIKLPSFNGEQLFRIKKTEDTMSTVTATAEPVFFDAKGDCFLVDVRPTDKSGQEALDIMCAAGGDGKYSGSSDITTTLTAYYEYKNLLEAISGDIDQSFLNRWGGEILYDNFTVIINAAVGEDNGVELRYGKNIPEDGMTITEDVSDVVTRIYPKAYNGRTMTDDGYVDSEHIDDYPIVHAQTITFEDIKLIDDCDYTEDDDGNEVLDEDDDVTVCEDQDELDEALKNACEEQFSDGIDLPSVTIEADMVLLQDTDQYADLAILETVSLGDTVHCINTLLDFETEARVIELEYDCLLCKVTAVVLGDYETDFLTSTSESVSALTESVSDLKTSVSEFYTVVTQNLYAVNADIVNLTADVGSFTDLLASYASIEYLQANYTITTEIDAMFANLENIYAKTATVTELLADYVTATELEAVTAVIDTLETSYASIDFANVTVATIETGFVSDLLTAQGLLSSTATFDTATVTGYLTGVGIVADSITAGTLDCANLTVSNLTVGSLLVGSINGYALADGTVSSTTLDDLLLEIIDAVNTNDAEVEQALEEAGLATTAVSTLKEDLEEAEAQLETVTSIANGKSTTYYAASAPSSTDFDLCVNDIWFDSDDGYAMYMWDGTAWELCQFSTGALSASSITAELIASSAVTAAKISSEAVTTEKLAAEAVTAAKIAAGTITATEIDVTSITAAVLSANTITATFVDAETIDGSLITAETITADQILSGTITATQIAAGTITATEIDVSSITAAVLTAGCITSDLIESGAVTADKISVSDLSALSATIGSFYIGDTAIYSVSGGTSIAAMSSNVYIGTDGISLGTVFKVTKAGAVTSTSGTIGKITIGSYGLYSYNSSYSGSYAGIYRPSTITTGSIAFHAGSTSYAGANASFKVTYGGALTATSATISGDITADSLTLGDGTISVEFGTDEDWGVYCVEFKYNGGAGAPENYLYVSTEGCGLFSGLYDEDASGYESYASIDLEASGEISMFGTIYSYGNLYLVKSSGTAAFTVNRTDTGRKIWFGIGSGGENRGIYDSENSKWLFYADEDDDIHVGTSTLGGTKNAVYLKSGVPTSGIKVDYGTVDITPSSASTPKSASVTYSTSFSATPMVVAVPNTSVPGTTVLGVGVTSRSSTGCTIYLTRTNTTTTTVLWIAVGY